MGSWLVRGVVGGRGFLSFVELFDHFYHAEDEQRWPQQREERTVQVDGHTVRVKVGAGRAKVEHDDAAAAAAALGRPLRDIIQAAESAAAAGRMQP